MRNGHQFWEVFPKSIRLSTSQSLQKIPLSIRGEITAPVFESSNPKIVSVDQAGVLSLGKVAGAAMVMIYGDSQRSTLRHVDIEVRNPSWFSNSIEFRPGKNIHVTGQVVDALSTRGISKAQVLIWQGEAGSVIAEFSTAADGTFATDLPEGDYLYKVSCNGYITGRGTVEVWESGVIGNRIVLSPLLQGKVGRIVLTWGASPEDLDSHLLGPLSDGSRFHIFYAAKSVADVAELDVDDTISYGPETITIHQIIPGIYRYCVHDFSNLNSTESFALANSEAMVTIYLQDGRQYKFTPPQTPGTVWTVFEIDGATGNITPINSLSYQMDPLLVGV